MDRLVSGDAWSSLRFAAGMTMIGGVFVLVQALLLLESLWAGPSGATPSHPGAVR